MMGQEGKVQTASSRVQTGLTTRAARIQKRPKSNLNLPPRLAVTLCSSGLGLTICLLLLVDLPVASMLPGLIGYTHTVGVLLLLMSYT